MRTQVTNQESNSQGVSEVDLVGRMPVLGTWNLGDQNKVCHKIKKDLTK